MAYPFQKNGTYPVPEPTLRPAAAAYRRIRRRFMRAIPETLRRGRDAFLSRPRRIGGTPRSRRVLFEPLEPRLLLSADLSFTALTASDLTLRVQDVEGTQHLQIVLADETAPGGEIIVTSQDLSLTNSVTLTGSAEADSFTVNLAGMPDSSVLSISIIDPTSGESATTADVLNITGGDANWDVTGLDAGQVNGINFSGIENLAGSAGSDSFNIGVAGSVTGTVGGGGGLDTLNQSALPGGNNEFRL